MIVKDESAVIERCLNSVKNIIDYWVIVDTGSLDGTQNIIKNCLKDIPGELHERSWKNFGHNRTEALQLAKEKGDYLLFMDADDWLTIEEGFNRNDLSKDCYKMRWCHEGGYSYFKPQLVKASLDWKWVLPYHEYLSCAKSYSQEPLGKVNYIYGGDGASSKDPEKFIKAARMLEEELERDPHNPRLQYYYADSLKDAGKFQEAIDAYKKRASMGGWREEVFLSLLHVALIKKQLQLPDEEVEKALHEASRFSPHRSEPIYFLSEIYNKRGDFSLSFETIAKWKPVPPPPFEEVGLKFNWISDYGLLLQESIAAFYLGRSQEFLELCDALLSIKNLPANWRKQVEINRSFVNVPKTVMIAILARNKAHFLDRFLECIAALDYDKKNISIYINTNDNGDETEKILEKWASKHATNYRSLFFETKQGTLGKIREESLKKAKMQGVDYYFVVDCDNFIAPSTLKELIAKDKPIIAPMLRSLSFPNDLHSNFFIDVDQNGYYKDHLDYYKILRGEKKGVFEVPVVHQTYLINTKYIDQLAYTDTSSDWEFIVFSRKARENKIPQFICNEKEFGTFFHPSKEANLEEEKDFLRDSQRLITASLASYSIGNFQEAIDLTEKALLNPRLSDSARKVLKKNLTYYYPGIEIDQFARSKWGSPPWEVAQKSTEKAVREFIGKPKLHVCTMASDYNNELKQLIHSCELNGLSIDVIGLNEPFSFGKRLRDYRTYLDDIPDDDVVLFVDAYDVLILGNEKDVLQKFMAAKSSCLFSTETNSHPFTHLKKYYPSCDSRFKYLNAGAYIGYSGALKDILDELQPIPDSTDDQGLLTTFFLYHPERIKLDYGAKLFLCLLDVPKEDIDFDLKNKMIVHKETGERPLIIHGNSIGKVLYQEIYEKLFIAP